jgi:hypothetical protein
MTTALAVSSTLSRRDVRSSKSPDALSALATGRSPRQAEAIKIITRNFANAIFRNDNSSSKSVHFSRDGVPEGKRNGNYRHGGRTKEMIEVWKLIKSLR